MLKDNSLYSSFNARNLSFKEVSSSFIPIKQLSELIKPESTMLMGPRGCGKTTLLKVLSPDSIKAVNHPEAKKILQSVKFISVYIPTDIQWKNQFNALKDKLDEDSCEFVFNAMVLLNVLVSLLRLFSRYLKTNVYIEQSRLIKENQICKDLNKYWKLEITGSKTFRTLELNLLTYLSELNEESNRATHSNFSKLDFNKFSPMLFKNFIDLLRIGITSFEQVLELPPDTKWALCFDELELLPRKQQNNILSLLRSTDQKIIFKITSTPIIEVNQMVQASPGNDYESIKLWVYDYSSRKDWRLFCNQLISKKFGITENIEEKLYQIFGNHKLDDLILAELKSISKKEEKDLIKLPEKFTKGTKEQSATHYLFKLLAYRDTSFKDYLLRRKIDPLNPISNESTEKSVFLQHKSEALQRLIFKSRTRKTPPIHYGLPYLYDICDGNPRLLVGLFNSLQSQIENNEKLIPINVQSNLVYNESKRFFSILKNHPDATVWINQKPINLSEHIIESLGKYFQEVTLNKPFGKSMPTTFIVDSDVNHKIVDILEAATYYGAIIYLDPVNNFSKEGIVGKRFKLSSFLCPKYKISTRVNSQANLSTILKLKPSSDQPNLFDNV